MHAHCHSWSPASGVARPGHGIHAVVDASRARLRKSRSAVISMHITGGGACVQVGADDDVAGADSERIYQSAPDRPLAHKVCVISPSSVCLCLCVCAHSTFPQCSDRQTHRHSSVDHYVVISRALARATPVLHESASPPVRDIHLCATVL